VIAGLAGVLLVGALAFILLLPPTRISRPPGPTVEPVSIITTEEATEAPEPTPVGTPTPVAAIDLGSNTPTQQPDKSGAKVVLLRPSRASASSQADAGVDSQGNAVTYEPGNAVDGQPDTTWRVAGDGTGQWLELEFADEISVQAIGIIPGYDKVDPFDNTDRFVQNRVVKVARFEFSDGTTTRASFEQLRTMQFVSLPQAVRTRSIRIVIEETYPPPPADQGGRDFTPISEVQVQGTP
jgi:hypothetical protein